MEREYHRIGYQKCVRKGQVRMVRRRYGGGYFTILTPPAGAAPTRRIAYRSQFVHVALGYPGLKLLPDLQRFREQHRDPGRVVNAYEPHEHVYDQLVRRPGTVIIRGGGIVASRVLQRLIDDRDRLRLQTRILHIFRTYTAGSHGPSIFMRRKGGRLVEDLLSLARIDGGLMLQMSPVDLREIAIQAADRARLTAPGLTVRVEGVPTTVPGTASGSPRCSPT